MSAPGRLIDSHAHVYRRDLPMAPGGLHVPAHDFEIDEYEAILDRHGVSYAVIAAPSFLGTYNDYTLRAIRERPRFKTTVILNPTTDPYVLKAMDADRAIGVRLSLRGAKQLPDFTAYEYKLFFRRLADLDWHVHLHIEGQRLPLVLPALQAAPVKLVVDHFGRPDPALGADSGRLSGPVARFRYGADLGEAVGRVPHWLRSGSAGAQADGSCGPDTACVGQRLPVHRFQRQGDVSVGAGCFRVVAATCRGSRRRGCCELCALSVRPVAPAAQDLLPSSAGWTRGPLAARGRRVQPGDDGAQQCHAWRGTDGSR